MNKSRLEAFSDGVIAIIITIMVLEMKAPNGVAWQVIQPLIPKFLSYALSFLFVAIYWNNHHHLLHTFSKVSASIMWANMNLLFWLSLIPFATAWMGENHFAKETVAAYAILALLCATAYNILQKTIAKTHQHSPEIKELVKPTGWKELTSLALYLISIPKAYFVNPKISGLLFLTVSILWLIPNKKIEKAFT